ncbi:hypothetical protein [Synechococcus sp. CCY 9618]|uniref:hypothetical protein n=1 Tax=Synechococcus sp. CCY 9618 TaxID=2815602 RepID=UPI001C2338A7|nr:hypothetical protein [Synechococcus sp. CCY 9618]
MTERDKEDAFSGREDPSRAVPAQPAFSTNRWPSNQPEPPSVLTPGQPVAPRPAPPPASFSFGDPTPALAEPVPEPPSPAPAAEPAAPYVAPPPDAPRPAPTSLAITTTGPDPQQLEMELAAARDELKALHEMLEDLPEIFERKFQQRLTTVMEHQKHLLADNQALRDRLYSLSPGDADGPGSGRGQPRLLPTVERKKGWGQALKRALRLEGPQQFSRHDDGRPITA